MAEHYTVIHESPMENSRGETRTDYGVASMLHSTREGAENALAYCHALQAEARPGTEGRYYIARVTEED